MSKLFLPLFAIAILFVGGASASAQGRFAWDGRDRDPNLPARQKPRLAKAAPNPNIERKRVLATLDPRSSVWRALKDEIDAEDDRYLNSKLSICRNCLPVEPVTSSHGLSR
jgi:hypothetical protein